MSLEFENVVEVYKIGYGRVKVTFKNYMASNNFADDKRIVENGWSVKIFAHFVSKIAIVFDIQAERIEILKSIRIVRKGKHTSEFIPSKKMKMLFKSSEVPRDVQYGYIKMSVKHYIAFA